MNVANLTIRVLFVRIDVAFYLITLCFQVSMATDWLCFNDEVTQYIQHKQDYRLMPYLPFLAVTFHLLFASNNPPRIQFPHSWSDVSWF